MCLQKNSIQERCNSTLSKGNGNLHSPECVKAERCEGFSHRQKEENKKAPFPNTKVVCGTQKKDTIFQRWLFQCRELNTMTRCVWQGSRGSSKYLCGCHESCQKPCVQKQKDHELLASILPRLLHSSKYALFPR